MFTDTDRRNKMNEQKFPIEMMEQFAQAMRAAMPVVKPSKNGYEIRTKVLEIAKDMEQFEFNAKFAGWEQTVKRDPATNEIVTSIELPKIPSADEVLASAQKFYNFVNGKTDK